MIIAEAQRFLSLIKKSTAKDYYGGEGVAKIQVDAFISKLALIYEKIRNTIDYREEHLLRKNAIGRILKRRLNLNLSADSLGLATIKELIRAGYLENNLLPVAKAEMIDKIVAKYLTVATLSGLKRISLQGSSLFNWLLTLAACEIEEALVPPLAHVALVDLAYEVLGQEVKIVDPNLNEDEKKLQILLALERTLVKADTAMISYLIWRYYNQRWLEADTELLAQVAKKVNNLRSTIQAQIHYPLSEKLFRLFKKQTIVFQVLKEIIIANPQEADKIFLQPANLEERIRRTCEKLYKKSRTKLRRSVWRVILYIFITKMLLILLLELPYEHYIAQSVIYLPLMINALFPPVLMFLIGLVIKVPAKKNTDTIVKAAQEIVYHGRFKSFTGVANAVKRSQWMSATFSLLYFALVVASFGFIIFILQSLSFSLLSMVIFLLFLSLVSFFGIKLRQGVRELIITEKKENPFAFLLNLLSLPFLRIGYWISVKFAKINLFVFIFDFLLEAPFKIFLEVIEDWLAFLKEKKEEIYNQQQ